MSEVGRENYYMRAVATGITFPAFRQVEQVVLDATKAFFIVLGASIKARTRPADDSHPEAATESIQRYLDMVPAAIVEKRGDVDHPALLVDIAEKAVRSGDIPLETIVKERLLPDEKVEELRIRLQRQESAE